MVFIPVAEDALAPVILVLVLMVQVYVVPLGTIVPLPWVGVTEKAVSEQIAVGVIFPITGFGFTLITTVKALPEQLLKTGVTV